MNKLAILISLNLSSLSLFAKNIELYSFTSNHPDFEYLLPVTASEGTPEKAFNNFKNSILINPSLRDIYSKEQLDNFKLFNYRKLNSNHQLQPQVLILGNRGYDSSDEVKSYEQQRIDYFEKKLKPHSQSIILPVGMTERLNSVEKKIFIELITTHFEGLLALGGSDLDPKIYNESNVSSLHTNFSRDLLEFEIIKGWLDFKKGFLFGVCRGHQLIATALGFKLNQHVDSHGHDQWVEHSIQISQNKNILKTIFPDKKSIPVNSYHHQAVQHQSVPGIQIIATSPDNTVEALQSFDERIFSTQFHFEFMDNFIGGKIFEFLNRKLQKNFQSRSCNQVFK